MLPRKGEIRCFDQDKRTVTPRSMDQNRIGVRVFSVPLSGSAALRLALGGHAVRGQS